MGDSPKSRKWAIVINNPQQAGLDHQTIADTLQKCAPAYWCMADEIGVEGTYHTHIFFYAPSAVRFSTLKKRFPTAHLERAYGSASENRDYVQKSGKWADTEKSETSVPGTFEEWGDLPAESEEKSPQMYQLVQSVREGKTNTEIIDASPGFAFRVGCPSTATTDRMCWYSRNSADKYPSRIC